MFSAIMKQLRTKVAAFSNRVYGSAEFAAIRDQDKTDLTIPSAYVIPLGDVCEENPNSVGYQQDVVEEFGVILAVSNTADRTGIKAADGLRTLRAQVFSAILNWSPDADLYEPIEYGGGKFLHMNTAILYWQLRFRTGTRLEASDGFQGEYEDLEDVITGIDMAEPSNEGGGPDGQIDAHANVENLNV